jgi:hypothetical protein
LENEAINSLHNLYNTMIVHHYCCSVRRCWSALIAIETFFVCVFVTAPSSGQVLPFVFLAFATLFHLHFSIDK